MKNLWNLDESEKKIWEERISAFVEKCERLESKIEEMSDEDFEKSISMDLSNEDINPSKLSNLLTEMGYEEQGLDCNGWQWDFWNRFGCLTMDGCGMTFQLYLRYNAYD